MSNPRTQVYIELLADARDRTLRTAEAVPEGCRLHQLKEGKATPLWLVGHLANTINTIVVRWMVEGESAMDKETSMLFAPDFAGGKPPSTNPEDYPAWDDVLALYNTAMTRAVEGLAGISDEELPGPLKGRVPDPMRQVFKSVEFSLQQMVHHDAYHRGQLGLLSSLGDPTKV